MALTHNHPQKPREEKRRGAVSPGLFWIPAVLIAALGLLAGAVSGGLFGSEASLSGEAIPRNPGRTVTITTTGPGAEILLVQTRPTYPAPTRPTRPPRPDIPRPGNPLGR